MRLIVAVAILILLAPFGAMAADGTDVVALASDKEAKVAITEFRKTRPVTAEAVTQLANVVHDDVVKELLKLLTTPPRNRELEDLALKEAVLKSLLEEQKPLLEDSVRRGLIGILAQQRASAEVLTLVVGAIGKLDCREAWREVVALLRYDQGEAVICAALTLLGDWKEVRAHKELQAFWDKHSSGGAGNFRRPVVSSSPTGGAEAVAQKAFDQRNKGLVGAHTLEVLRAISERITGRDDMTTGQRFRDWCKSDEGKRRIYEAMRQRDE